MIAGFLLWFPWPRFAPMGLDGDRDALLAALIWQVELGADEAILDAPVDRMAVSAQHVPQRAASNATTPPSPDAGVDDAGAGALAAACASLDDLRRAMEGFEGCALKEGARNTVFADGNPASPLMIVGEAPGRDEDVAGKPFVGRSGQLLDRMLAALGRAREEADPARAAYITNVLPWRPPQNRDPSTDEAVMLRAFLVRHIELAGPKVLITMGNAATKTLLETETGITRMRGKWQSFMGVPVMPTFHPAALLRNPAQKREVWSDLLDVEAKLKEIANG